MLANGPLTGFPKRPSDQETLLVLAALRFEPGKAHRESEVNAILSDWLASFCAPFGVDHVSLRRTLVDFGFLVRDRAGSTYRADPQRIREAGADAAGVPDPARVLLDLQAERRSRKRARPAQHPTEEPMSANTPAHSHDHEHAHEHAHEHVHRHGDLVHSHPHTHSHRHAHGHEHSHEDGHEPGDAAHPHAHVPEAHDHAHEDLGGEAHERAPHDHEHK